MEHYTTTPILFPLEPEAFWKELRRIIHEEVSRARKEGAPEDAGLMATPGLTRKPLYRMGEVCTLFGVTRPTIYGWVKHGKLKPFKIRSRVYFMAHDIEALLEPRGVA